MKCILNCSLDQYYNSSGTATNTTCPCLGDAKWKASHAACVIDCSKYGQPFEFHIEKTECICINGSLWNSEYKFCQVDCTKD
jgi:hypothetical protein